VVAWDAAAAALGAVRASKKKPAQAPVLRVLATPDPSAIAVVLADSSVLRAPLPKPDVMRPVDGAGAAPEQGCRAVAAFAAGDLVLVAFEDKARVPYLRVVSVAADGTWSQVAVLPIPGAPGGGGDSRLVACAHNPTTRTLCCLWSSGAWAVVSLGQGAVPAALSLVTSGPFLCLDLARPVAADWVGRDVLVVAGVLAGSWEGKPGVPPKGSVVAMAVETVYGTAHSVQLLAAPSVGESVVQVLTLGEARDSGRPALVAVATSTGVFTCDVHVG
jgi:hypothetical protein